MLEDISANTFLPLSLVACPKSLGTTVFLLFIWLQTKVTETTAPELVKLLYWLMVVGYSIRNIEVRFDMERVLGTAPKLQELPPGETLWSEKSNYKSPEP